MNTHTLVRGIDDFLPAVSEKSYLFSWLQIMRAWSTDMAVAVGKSIDGKDGSAITQYLRSIQGEVRAVKARALFSAIEDTGESLDRLEQSLRGGDDGAAARARRLLNRFGEAYEAYLESPSPRTVYTLVLSADMLRTALVAVAGLLSAVKDRLRGEPQGDADEDQLSLLMPSPVGFQDFTDKLVALGDMYEAAGAYLNGGEKPAPLRVGKIESGSMWIWVSGQAEAIAVLRRSIAAIAAFIYRQHAAAGSPWPDADEALRLCGLEESGPGDDSGSKGRVSAPREVAARIAQDVAVLVRGQPEIEINGQAVCVGEVSRQRYLEGPAGEIRPESQRTE